jgi:hypothetical protein
MDAGVLEALRQAGRAAWVMLDDDLIQRVVPPIVGRVTYCAERAGHMLHAGLDSSPLTLTMSVRTTEDEGIAEVLRSAVGSREIVSVAADETATILDAERAAPDERLHAPAFTAGAAEPLEAVPTSLVPAVDLPILAQRIDRLDCGPLAAPPCLPFRHPASGCDARAHSICEVLAASGLVAGKVWVFDFPVAEDDAAPGGAYRWHWYVAPFVRAGGPAAPASVRVVDPALVDGFVSLESFRKRLGVPPTALRFSRAAYYRLDGDGRGAKPRPGEVANDLAVLRALARVRLAQGPA